MSENETVMNPVDDTTVTEPVNDTTEVVTEPVSDTTATETMNDVIEAVMDEIDDLNLFSTIRRGALGTGAGLCCEVGPSTPQEVYLDKDMYLPIDLTINGKHGNLETLSEAMNSIHGLARLKSYPSGTGWKIVDIRNGTMPQVIGREDNNAWVMASSLIIKVYFE